jgi:hypothetical protein
VAICDSLTKAWRRRKNRSKDELLAVIVDMGKADQGCSRSKSWKWMLLEPFVYLAYFCKDISSILQVKNNHKTYIIYNGTTNTIFLL